MPISFSCSCGKAFRVQESAAGKRAKCPGCGEVLVVPQPEDAQDAGGEVDTRSEAPAPPEKKRPTPVVNQTKPVLDENAKRLAAERYAHLKKDATSASLQEYAYWLLLLAFLPLTLNLLQDRKDDLPERFLRSFRKAFPPKEEKVASKKTAPSKAKNPPPVFDDAPLPMDELGGREPSIDQLLTLLPDNRIEGAFLPRKTAVHWLYALLTAALFLGLALFLFPEVGHLVHLLVMFVFTATVGILLLLLAQVLADWTQGHILISRNFVVMLLFWIAWAIGFSYRAALDPTIGFVPSFLGFTFGVGYCEEVCKAVPVLFHYRMKGGLPWRTACAWGFVSGVGFGVSEGVMYAADFYNGIEGGDIYLVRFVSCVALHGIWAASAALFIHKHKEIIQAQFVWYEFIPRALFLVAIPMILHGLYDTFLKKEMNALALLTALGSFGWFAWSIEQARAAEEGKPDLRRA